MAAGWLIWSRHYTTVHGWALGRIHAVLVPTNLTMRCIYSCWLRRVKTSHGSPKHTSFHTIATSRTCTERGLRRPNHTCVQRASGHSEEPLEQWTLLSPPAKSLTYFPWVMLSWVCTAPVWLPATVSTGVGLIPSETVVLTHAPQAALLPSELPAAHILLLCVQDISPDWCIWLGANKLLPPEPQTLSLHSNWNGF